MKNQTKGITLIALVITIIVLLILAGVTIATLTGDNGLLQKAGEAKNTTIEAEGLERIKLAVMASHDENGINTTSLAKNLSQINNLTDTNNQAIFENTEITLPTIINLNDKQYMIKEDGSVTTPDYIKNGLILYLDGINNTRNGHCTTTTTWEDLSGNNNDFTKKISNAVWSDNSFIGKDENRTLVLNKAILSNSSECSVEVCYDIPQLKNYYWVFQSRQNNQPPNGFQFSVGSTGRGFTLYNNNSIYHSLSTVRGTPVTELEKRTMAFAVNSNDIIFSDNGQFYFEETKEGIIESLISRNCYTIGSAYPWGESKYVTGGNENFFEGNIYSIRVYNRKLSKEELKNNYEVDRVRFNMD